MVPLNITLVGKQLVEWAPPHSIWIILLPMRRLPLHGYLKPLLPQCIASMGREIDHWKGGRNGTRRGPAFIIFFLGLPDTVQDLPWGRGWEARDHGVHLWVLWLSQGIGTCIIVILVCFSWGNFLLETTINGDLMLYNCLCLCMQYAHRECVQRWCDEKGSTLCEICLQVGVSALCSSIFLRKKILSLHCRRNAHCTSCGVAKQLSLVGESVS